MIQLVGLCQKELISLFQKHFLKCLVVMSAIHLIKQFYSSAIGVSQLTTWKNNDGSTTNTFMFDTPHKGIQIQFTQGSMSAEPRDDEFTVAEFESYMMSVHH